MNDIIFTGVGQMIAVDLAVRAIMILVGVGAALHYWLMCNAITVAPQWLKLTALPGAVGSAVVMVASGLLGATVLGLAASLFVCANMIVVNLAVWHSGAYVSDQFRKASIARAAAIARTNQILNPVYGGAEFAFSEDSEIFTPAGWVEFELQSSRQKDRA